RRQRDRPPGPLAAALSARAARVVRDVLSGTAMRRRSPPSHLAVNRSSHARLRRRSTTVAAVAFLALAALGCGHTRKSLLVEKTVPLPGGRFAGPVDIDLPRQA